jgi:hypothetical protein
VRGLVEGQRVDGKMIAMQRASATRLVRTGWLAGWLTAGALAGRPAAAHVAPAVSDNNRYLKLTPLGDRVRLAYTIFYGEVPGAALRKSIDANHDGAIDDAESQAFGSRIADELAAALTATVDGAPQPIAWSQVVVGMGTPRTDAGAFSIDLVASLCLAAPRGKHAIELRDRFALESPGETEIRFEDSPNITVGQARVGDDTDPGFDYKIIGPTPVLAAPGPAGGIALAFTAGPQAVIASDATCARARPGQGAPIDPIAVIGAVAGAAIAVAAGAITLARRRRKRRR